MSLWEAATFSQSSVVLFAENWCWSYVPVLLPSSTLHVLLIVIFDTNWGHKDSPSHSHRMRISRCQGVRMHTPSNQFFSVLLDTETAFVRRRAGPHRWWEKGWAIVSLSSQQLQFQLLGSSGPGAPGATVNQGGKAACWVSILASKSSNLMTVVTVGCHTLDAWPCQIQSCPETIKELWEKHGKTCFKVTYFDSCRTCIAHTVVASLRTTLTQLRPVRWQTAAWDLIQESPAEVKRIATVA